MRVSRMIEALLFASQAPLSAADLSRAEEGLDEERVDGVRKGRTAFVLEPAGGGTMVTIHSEVDIPRLLSPIAKPAVTRALEQQLANLDRLSSAG